MKILNKYILEITAFVGGGSIMILELTASRVLAPYVGTSFFVWTSLIGVILAALSIGYFVGGKISKNPSVAMLSKILFFIGFYIFFISIFYKEIIGIIIAFLSFNVIITSLVSIVILFAIPSILFGTLTPYLARLKIRSIEESGKTVGNLYAISTIGSIVGTFLTGFFLISFLGTSHILIALSVILIGNALLVSFLKKISGRTVGIIFLLLCSFTFFGKVKASEIETQYGTVEIVEHMDNISGKNTRFMIINGLSSSAVYIDGEGLAFPYYEYYNLANHFNPDFKSVLMIGGAGYAYPTYLLNNNSTVTIDVVEIDPGVTKLARQYFGLIDSPRIKIFHEDGRIFLNRTDNKYDAIFIDAFSTHSIPHHLVTIEAARNMENSLNENGIVISNVVSSITGERGKTIRSIYKTFRAVFPHVYLFPVFYPGEGDRVQNVMLVALKSTSKPSLVSNDTYLNSKLQHLWKEKIEDDVPILTDEYSPIEQYMLDIYKDLKVRKP